MKRLLFLLMLVLAAAALSAPLASSEPIAHASACANDQDCDGAPDNQDFCPQQAGTMQYGGCPDTDGDGLPDNRDACPTTAAPGSTGCPDADHDNVADSADACPKAYGPAASQGCPDSDGDGLTDNNDPCPDEGKDPRYPKRKVRANGCYPTYVAVSYAGGKVGGVASDGGGVLKAACDFNHDEKCVVHMTMTLSAKSASALGLKNPRIASVKIPLTTKSEKEAANPSPPACGCRPAARGKLDLGLSSSLRKRIAKLRSITMTMRVTYTLASDSPVSLDKKTYKLTREYSSASSGSNTVENIAGFDDRAQAGGPEGEGPA